MSCWSVLELEENASLKEIKKSYAKKLKYNKPDENPEGFQRLNAAYQKACKIAKQKARQQTYEAEHAELESLEQPIPETTTASNPTPLIEKEVSEQEMFSPEHEETQYDPVETPNTVPLIERELSRDDNEKLEPPPYTEDDLIHDVDELMESDHINDLSKWEALLDSQLLYEIRFRGWFTLRLFYLVSKKIAENEENHLSHETLVFLNEKIMWTNQTDRLEAHFDFEEIERVKNHLKPKPKPKLKEQQQTFKEIHKTEKERITDSRKQHASIFKRFAAFVIDILIFSVGLNIIWKINDAIPDSTKLLSDNVFWVFIIWLLILFPLMESLIQATPGKFLVGIKVVTEKGKKLNILHAFLRFILCIINLAAIKITLLINSITFDGRFLHDRLSSSKVVDRSQND